MMELTLHCKFTHNNTVRDKKPYTIYEIELRASGTNSWVIYKRYSHFYSLDQELRKTSKKSELPTLPPKRLIRSLAAEFVEKRKQELESYLKGVLAIPDVLHLTVMQQFLEIPDSVMLVLLGPSHAALTAQTSGTAPGHGYSSQHQLNRLTGYNASTLEERRVLEVISLLKYQQNRVSATKQFEEYFFSQRPSLSPESIHLLLVGEADVGGLIHAAGDIAYSHVASRAALNLLLRLFDVEQNKDAQSFLDALCELDIALLQHINLNKHILQERGLRMSAFRLLSILKSYCNVSVDQILTDPVALKEFLKWYERSGSPEAAAVPSIDRTLRPIPLDAGYKQTAYQTLMSLFSVYESTLEWRKVLPISSLPRLDNINEQVSLAYKKDPVRNMVTVRLTSIMPFSVAEVRSLLGNLKRRREWDTKFHKGYLLQALDNSHDVLHLIFKSFSSPYKYRDVIVLQSYTTLEDGTYVQACRSVLHSQAPDGKEHVRAVLFPTGYIVAPLFDQKVNIHSFPPKSPYQQIECNRLPTNNSNEASNSSTPGSSSLSTKTLQRSPPKPTIQMASSPLTPPTLHLSNLPPPVGESNDACALTFITQMDKESVLILSPDLLGETNELRQIFNNMKVLLAREYGMRTLQPSNYTRAIADSPTLRSVKNFGQISTLPSLNQNADIMKNPETSIHLPFPVFDELANNENVLSQPTKSEHDEASPDLNNSASSGN